MELHDEAHIKITKPFQDESVGWKSWEDWNGREIHGTLIKRDPVFTLGHQFFHIEGVRDFALVYGTGHRRTPRVKPLSGRHEPMTIQFIPCSSNSESSVVIAIRAQLGKQFLRLQSRMKAWGSAMKGCCPKRYKKRRNQ